jgi:hypothetical protein
LSVGLGAAPVLADDARKEALTREVLQLTGTSDFNAEIAASVLTQLRPAYPTVPEEVWSDLAAGFSQSEITQLSIPIYLSNFSEEELAELVGFYKSPIGRKVVERTPIIMEQSMLAYGEWNERKVLEVIETLKASGYEPQGFDPPGVGVPDAPTPQAP